MQDIVRAGLESRVIENLQRLDALPTHKLRHGFTPTHMGMISQIISDARTHLQREIRGDLDLLIPSPREDTGR